MKNKNTDNIDFSSKQEFFDYYATQSISEENAQRILSAQNMIMRKFKHLNNRKNLNVMDVGCGAGAASIFWAKQGHHLHALDINEPLVELAMTRAEEEGVTIDFKLGTANNLPWADETMDICLVPELLEHVNGWENCLNEFVRVLKPNGVLFLSTNNKLCPKQQEYTLPMYSWYPGIIKRYCEKLAVTTHPEIAGYATYPAINWFTFFQLKKILQLSGMMSFDRFDLMDKRQTNRMLTHVLSLIKKHRILRWFAHIFTPYTVVLAVKKY